MASRYAVSLEEAMRRQAEPGAVVYGIRCMIGEYVVAATGRVARVFRLDQTEPVSQGVFRFVRLKGKTTLRVTSSQRDVPPWSSARILAKFILKEGRVESV